MTTEAAAVETTPTTETASEEARPLSVQETLEAWEKETPAQPRDEQGRFQGEEEPAVPVEGAPAEGTTPTDQAEATTEAADATDAAGEDAPTEDDGAYTLKLPGRRDGDEEVEIQLDGLSPEERERVAQLVNGYERGVKKRELEARQSELDGIYQQMEADPVSFLSTRVKPELPRQVALSLLTELMEGEEWEAVVEEINGMEEDPAARQKYRAPETAAADPEVEANVKGLHDAVLSFIPEDASDEDAAGFEQAALAYLFNFATARKLDKLDPSEVPGLVARIAKGYGFAAPTTSAPAAPAAPAPEQVAAAQATGPKLVKASTRRKEVSSIAPSGLGATSASGLQPPPGLSVEQTLEWFAKQK